MSSQAPSSPEFGSWVPVSASQRPVLPPGGPGSGALFCTRYFPLGELAGMAQDRIGLPVDCTSKTGALLRRSQVETFASPPMMSVDPFALTAWQVLQPVSPAAPKKSSGADAPGLMRRTRPMLLAQ